MNEQVQAELKKMLNGRFSTSESARANYARGEDTYDPILSQAVVFPETNEEVSKILKLCNDHKIPVVPFGTGTSLEGNVVGNENGITICLEKMNKILSVNVEDFDCRVQACVTREQLNEFLREDGVFFPIDPGANAALGGMASTSASGTMAVKYGTMKTVISGLTVVLPNGDIIKTGGRTTVKPVITVFMVPYLTAIVPDAEVDAIPPIAALAPGSIGKKTPSSLKCSFNCSLVTQA